MKIDLLLKFLIFSLFIYIITTSLIIKDLPEHDEIVYIDQAKGIDNFGVPLTYMSEPIGYSFFLPHPPLYPYLLFLNSLLFNDFLLSLKIFNILCLFLTIYFSYLIIKELQKKNTTQISLLFISLFLINTVVIRKSLLIKVDTSILTLLLTIFIYFLIKQYKLKNAKSTPLFFFFTILFALCLWAKFATSIILLFTVLLFLLLKKKYSFFIFYFFIGLTGSLLFLLTWYIYSSYIGASFTEPFWATFLNRVSVNPPSFKIIIKHLFFFPYYLLWFSPPFFILLFFATFDRIKKFFISKKLFLIDFLVMYILITLFSYLIHSPDIYYIFAIVPISFIIISHYLIQNNIIYHISKHKTYYISFFFFFFLYYSFIPDLLRLIPNLLPINDSTNYILMLIIVYIFPVLLFMSIALFSKNIIKYLIIFSLLFMLSMNVSLDLKQAFADYSTGNFYGEKGYQQAFNYINKYTSSDDIIISPGDFADLLNRKYYSVDLLTKYNLCGDDNSIKGIKDSSCDFGVYDFSYNLTEVITKHNIPYIVYSDYLKEMQGGFSEESQEIINKYYMLDKQFGNFYIYKIKI